MHLWHLKKYMGFFEIISISKALYIFNVSSASSDLIWRCIYYKNISNFFFYIYIYIYIIKIIVYIYPPNYLVIFSQRNFFIMNLRICKSNCVLVVNYICFVVEAMSKLRPKIMFSLIWLSNTELLVLHEMLNSGYCYPKSSRGHTKCDGP